tara:strand:+ start:802 stop:1368 length:567 start_codon:yes stop_codon:yes gene_type:complete
MISDNDGEEIKNNIMVNALIKGGWDSQNTQLDIDNAETLDAYVAKTPLNYYEAWRLAMCIGLQISACNSLHKSFLFFSPKNILRISPDWYLILDRTDTVPIIGDRTVIIERPINIEYVYAAPELRKKITQLPFQTNISCAFYSAGAIIKWAMQLKDPIAVSGIAKSQLHYFLERVMLKDPAHRRFLLI